MRRDGRAANFEELLRTYFFSVPFSRVGETENVNESVQSHG